MFRITALTYAIIFFLCGTPAIAQTRASQDDALQSYLAKAGEPVDSFPYYSLQKWELVGPNRVVVWTRVNTAWLLTVDEPCSELQYTQSIALTSSARQVRQRFDTSSSARASSAARSCRFALCLMKRMPNRQRNQHRRNGISQSMRQSDFADDGRGEADPVRPNPHCGRTFGLTALSRQPSTGSR